MHLLSKFIVDWLTASWGYFVFKIWVVCLYIFIGFLIERIFRKEARSTADNRFFNYGCTLIYFCLDATAGLLLGYWIGSLIVRVHEHFHIFQTRPRLPFAIGLAILATLIGDLAYYWLHRWQHSSPWLWATHELHHSDECVNITTTFREHWLEIPPRMLFAGMAALVLPAPMAILPMSAVLGCAQTFFNHANADFHLRWINRVFVDTSTHRIHHSTRAEHINKNFGGIFSFWDVVFGTYVRPVKGDCPPTGLLAGSAPQSVLAATVQPFVVWHRLVRNSLAPRETVSPASR